MATEYFALLFSTGSPDRWALTCGSHFVEVICPVENDARFPRPALHGTPCQSRQAEDDGEVNQGHEEGVVEALRQTDRQDQRDRETHQRNTDPIHCHNNITFTH